MKALRVHTPVDRKGRLRLRKGAEVEVIILEPETGEDDLAKAAESSLSFWNNRIDDEVWNDVGGKTVAKKEE